METKAAPVNHDWRHVRCPECDATFVPPHWEQREQQFDNYLANRRRFEVDRLRNRPLPHRKLDLDGAVERWRAWRNADARGHADRETGAILLSLDLPALIREVRHLHNLRDVVAEFMAAINGRNPNALAAAVRHAQGIGADNMLVGAQQNGTHHD